MRYEVRAYTEANAIHSVTRYGVYDVKGYDSVNSFSGLIYLFDNENYANIVCYYLNKDNMEVDN